MSRPVEKSVPKWIDGEVLNSSSLGTISDTAQVHPFKLTNTFLSCANELCGSEVKTAVVKDIIIENDIIKGVRTDNGNIEASTVIICMGPWSQLLCKKLNLPKIEGQRAHSTIFRPKDVAISPHALFVNLKSRRGRDRSPEVYPRPDGTVYMCAEGDETPLPDDPTLIKQDSCEDIVNMAKKISTHLRSEDVVMTQACYLPSSETGLPVIGKLPNVQGAFIAAGHSCWGILNAPGTGKALSELIVDGESTFVDLAPFQP